MVAFVRAYALCWSSLSVLPNRSSCRPSPTFSTSNWSQYTVPEISNAKFYNNLNFAARNTIGLKLKHKI